MLLAQQPLASRAPIRPISRSSAFVALAKNSTPDDYQHRKTLAKLGGGCTGVSGTDALWSRRLLFTVVTGLTAAAATGARANATGIDVLQDAPGIGTRGARRGDLILFHYVGRLEASGKVFDSTRGGETFRDGGVGVLRPAAVALGGGPVPGICEGLQQALEGMSIGGKRTVRVPAALGFGAQTVLAPYGIVPGDSALLYDVELLRLSAVGPDQLTQGIAKCGAGGANQQSENCDSISYAEFL